MLQFDNKILLTDIHKPINWTCSDAKKQNEVTYDLDYTVIDRDALCGCDLRTKEFFIPRRSCPQNIESGKFHYVINAFAFIAMKDHIDQNITETSLFQLYDKQPNVTFPIINITNLMNKDPLFSLEQDIQLDLKDVIQSLNTDIDSDVIKEFHLTDIYHLFVGKSKVIGYALLLGIISTISIFLIILICKRQMYLKKLIYAIILKHVPMAEAKDTDLIVIESWNHYIMVTVIMFVTMIVMQILFVLSQKLIHKIMHAVPTLEIPKVLRCQNKAKLYLCLKTHATKFDLPICSILAQPETIRLENEFGIENIKIERNCLRHNMLIDWSTDNSNLIIENIKVEIPKRIPINMFAARKLKAIIDKEVMLTLLVIDQYNIAHVIAQRLYTPSLFEAITHVSNNTESTSSVLRFKKNLLLQNMNANDDHQPNAITHL
jgi:hypothetical protein